MEIKEIPEQAFEEIARQRDWNRMAQLIDQVCDTLGKPIDKDIKPTVIALRLLRFPTHASCEGHTDRGRPFPWIKIGPTVPHWQGRSKELRGKWEKENLEIAQRMADFLGEFYLRRRTPYYAMLHVKVFVFNFSLQSIGGELIEAYPKKDKAQRMKRCKEEMASFTEFLKKKI